MTAEEHRAQHLQLHAELEDLVSCYIKQEGLKHLREGRSGLLSGTSVLEFIVWSARMCTEAGESPNGAAS